MDEQEVKRAIREARKLIEEVQKLDGNEAETRRRVERIFEVVCGYDAFKHLSREHAVHGAGDTEHMDFAITVEPDKVAMVVELKRVNIDLAKKHLKQASRYALDLGCEWLLLTNGRSWEIHHMEFSQPPEARLIKAWNLMSDEMPALIEAFELISLRSMKRRTLDELWKTQSVLTPKCLLTHMLSEDSIRQCRNAIRKEFGVSVPPEDIVGAIRGLLNDNAGALMDEMKISLPERRKRRSQSIPNGGAAVDVDQEPPGNGTPDSSEQGPPS